LDAHRKRRNIMDINALQKVFMWCTIINGAWFVFAAMICVFAGGWVFRMQSKWEVILFLVEN
jgi:hypothetical protein